ncbi:unnamed protein product [Rhizophagus irregularis]|uniref:Uncharacterized protein n=1 Tax=Rhizophagus irregularis TaxID=588596 RepID=A0A915ZJJ8_9GLOM|nr:unnamed protein product [Rhizophagus irregularis]CAB5379740.1 unnamed protein product [Rhizophagus irregularis]
MFTRKNKHSDNIINWNYKGVVAKRCNEHNIIISDDGTSCMETSDVDFNNKCVLYLIENPDQIIMDETKEQHHTQVQEKKSTFS